MAWPITAHADQGTAINDLINRATGAGYTSIDTDLGERGLVYSILANNFDTVRTDNISPPTTNGSLTLGVNGTGGIIVGGGTALTGVRVLAATLTPGAAAASTATEQAFSLQGFTNLTTNDTVIFPNKPTVQNGLAIGGARVTGAGTLGIQFINRTDAAITPTAGEVYKVVAVRGTPATS